MKILGFYKSSWSSVGELTLQFKGLSRMVNWIIEQFYPPVVCVDFPLPDGDYPSPEFPPHSAEIRRDRPMDMWEALLQVRNNGRIV